MIIAQGPFSIFDIVPKSVTKDLQAFLKPFPPEVCSTALSLRDFVWDLYPDCNELIYDNYNALAIGFSASDRASGAFCSIAVYSKYVNFGFMRGSELSDPEGMLEGEGSLYRRITVRDLDEFPEAYMKRLLKEAYRNSMNSMKGKTQRPRGVTITKSVSKVKRRPGKKTPPSAKRSKKD